MNRTARSGPMVLLGVSGCLVAIAIIAATRSHRHVVVLSVDPRERTVMGQAS